MLPLSEFSLKVIKRIQQIPKGKVATYKQIGELAGKAHASRGVAWILHSCSRKYKLPWHRVLNSQGKISFDKKSSKFKLQKNRLEKEGVQLDQTGKLNLKKFQWNKKPPKTKAARNQPQIFR